MTIYIFPPLPGVLHAKAFNMLRQQILALCTTVFPEESHGYGALGAILPQREWLLLRGIDLGDVNINYSFVPPQRPGPFPNTATAQAVWKRDDKIFTSYTAGLHIIKAFILASVDPMLLRTIDPRNVSYLMSPGELLALLDSRYLVMNPSDIAQARASLMVPYTTSTLLRVYIAEHIDTHLLLEANNAIVNGVDQFQALLLGVSKCGLFRESISHYMTTHTTTILQTFDSLSASLVAAADNMTAPATTQHMAMSVVTEDMSLALTLSEGDANFKLSGKQPSDPKQRIVLITQHFCGIHGWCTKFHKGCKKS
jgi:hypothetical protein